MAESRGREPFGTVQSDQQYESLRLEITEKLSRIRDPDTSEPFVRGRRREDIFEGERTVNAPDIILTLAEGYEVGWNIMLLGHRFVFCVGGHYVPGTGCHRRDGLFIVEGPGVQQSEVTSEKSIVDLAPTILHSLGLLIPDDMDGRAMSKVLRPECLQKHPVVHGVVEVTQAFSSDADSVFSEDDERIVYDRLRGLGYLD